MVVGLVGYAGAGKSTVANALVNGFGAARFRHSDLLRKVADTFGWPCDALTLGRVWKGLSREFGEAMMADRVCALLAASCPGTNRLAVVDGIRILAEIDRYRALEDFVLVKVRAGQSDRFERVRDRGEKDGERGMTREEFLAIEESLAYRDMRVIMEMPGHDLVTDGAEEELPAKIALLLDIARRR